MSHEHGWKQAAKWSWLAMLTLAGLALVDEARVLGQMPPEPTIHAQPNLSTDHEGSTDPGRPAGSDRETTSHRFLRLSLKIASGAQKDVDELVINWTVLPSQWDGDGMDRSVDAVGPDSSQLGKDRPRAGRVADSVRQEQPIREGQMVVQRIAPCQVAVLGPDQAERIIDSVQSHARINFLSRPTVMVVDGQQAKVQVGRQRPFVVGIHDGEPSTIVFSEGYFLTLSPKIMEPATVQLACQVDLRAVESVREYAVEDSEGMRATLQWPITNHTRCHVDVPIRLGETVVLGGLNDPTDSGDRSVVVFITAEEAELDGPIAQIQRGRGSKTR